MLLQIALDVLSIEEALKITKQVAAYVDIIELGTPLLKEESTEEAIKIMKASFPDKLLLADLKTMDVGQLEASMAFEAGADIMTVCAAAENDTIKAALNYAKRHGKKVMVDLIGIDNIEHKVARAKEIEKMNPDYICVHTGIDEQKKGATPLKDFSEVKKAVKTKLAVAGGIDLKNINDIVKMKPEIVIVGSAITNAKNPKEAARKIKEKIERA